MSDKDRETETVKIIPLPYGICVRVDGSFARLESNLHVACPHCGELYCNFSCEESRLPQSEGVENAEEVKERLAYNRAIDGAESVILAMITAGIDVDRRFYSAVMTAMDGIVNNT